MKGASGPKVKELDRIIPELDRSFSNFSPISKALSLNRNHFVEAKQISFGLQLDLHLETTTALNNIEN